MYHRLEPGNRSGFLECMLGALITALRNAKWEPFVQCKGSGSIRQPLHMVLRSGNYRLWGPIISLIRCWCHVQCCELSVAAPGNRFSMVCIGRPEIYSLQLLHNWSFIPEQPTVNPDPCRIMVLILRDFACETYSARVQYSWHPRVSCTHLVMIALNASKT